MRRLRPAAAAYVLGLAGLTLLDALLALSPVQVAVPLAMAALGALALRGRIHPVAVAAASIAVTGASLLAGPVSGLTATLGLGECLVLLVGVAAASRRAAGIRGWTGTALAVVAVVAVPLRLASPDSPTFAVLLLSAAACALAAGAVLRDLDAERRLALERATREERDGLARDLHDDLTNRLTGMVLQLQATRRALGADGGALDADLAAVEDAGGAALASMRAWVRTLRATDVERDAELSSTPTEGLAELLARWEATSSGGRADLDDRTPADVPDDVRATAIRIVQEAVTNATRHAPGARWIRVALRAEGADLVVEVVSPRMVPGGDPVPGSPGLGLLGMRERAALVGGQVAAGPSPAGGTTAAGGDPDDGPTWRVLARLPRGGAA